MLGRTGLARRQDDVEPQKETWAAFTMWERPPGKCPHDCYTRHAPQGILQDRRKPQSSQLWLCMGGDSIRMTSDLQLQGQDTVASCVQQ